MASDITEELGVTLARKERRGAKVRGRTWWCPFCDFSQQMDDQNICKGQYEGLACGAVFADGSAIRTVVTDVAVDPEAFQDFLDAQEFNRYIDGELDKQEAQTGKPAEDDGVGEPESEEDESGEPPESGKTKETKAENQVDVPEDLTCTACGFVAKSSAGYKTHYARKH